MLRLIQTYYLSSPLFFFLGLLWGVELRASFISSPGLRFLYYLLITALGLLTWFRPGTAAWVAMGESSLNLLLLFLWILLPIWNLTGTVLEGGSAVLPYTPAKVLANGALAGALFVVGFHRAQRAALGTPR